MGHQFFRANKPTGDGAPKSVLDVDLRPIPAAFLCRHLKQVPQLERMLAGTSLEKSNIPSEELLWQQWPDQITVRDYLTIVGNLATIGPDPGYHIEYANAGVPLFSGGLDIGMRFAPTARDALLLISEYGSERPGYVEYLVYEEGDLTVFEVRPTTSLGRAYANIVEAQLLVICRMINRQIGRTALNGTVELQYSSPTYVKRLEEALPRPIHFNAQRNCLIISTSDATAQSMLFDEEQWLTALRTCAEERKQREESDPLADVRRVFVNQLRDADGLPKLANLADALGISSRTLIRRFRAAGISFQQFKDVALFSHATKLLSHPAMTVEAVAEELGFADASGFHRSFRRWTGKTPRQFRQTSGHQGLAEH